MQPFSLPKFRTEFCYWLARYNEKYQQWEMKHYGDERKDRRAFSRGFTVVAAAQFI